MKSALLGYNDLPASPPAPGGGGPDVNYTFDDGTQGWALNDWDNPDFTNLGAVTPDAGTLPTLRFADTDGDPIAGALKLTVAFTAIDQYAAAHVDFAKPGLNLSGKTLHARVRLVSGTFASGGLQLYVCTGPSYICGESLIVNSASLTPGEWVSLTLDLSTVTVVGFDASGIMEIGVSFFSSSAPVKGGNSDGGMSDAATFANTGEIVFEIDAVTD